MISANVFDIKRFGINDGGGIRTVLFLKGCPLRCRWCQNPEGFESGIRVWHARGACVRCRSCAAVCKRNALRFDERGLAIGEDCVLCGECVRACPTGAVRFDAKKMSVDEALEHIEKDRAFFGSEGGVTLSGGECTASPEFSLAVLWKCKEKGIHTAIETCMHAPPETMDAFAEVTDQILADIKLIDPIRHVKATGTGNALILENIRRLSGRSDLLLRIPLIPGFTADRENLEGIAAFIASLDVDVKPPVQLLNFNPMCREKYDSLRRTYGFDTNQRALAREKIRECESIMADYGLSVH